jgi:hypothetical protein
MTSMGYIMMEGKGVAAATIRSHCGNSAIGTYSPPRKPERSM